MIQGVAAEWSFSPLSANKGVNQLIMRFTPFIIPKINLLERHFAFPLLREIFVFV